MYASRHSRRAEPASVHARLAGQATRTTPAEAALAKAGASAEPSVTHACAPSAGVRLVSAATTSTSAISASKRVRSARHSGASLSSAGAPGNSRISRDIEQIEGLSPTPWAYRQRTKHRCDRKAASPRASRTGSSFGHRTLTYHVLRSIRASRLLLAG